MVKSKIYSIIVTEECNLGCVYCYAQKGKKRRMNAGIVRQVCDYVAKDIKVSGLQNAGVVFSGNEPLLNMAAVRAIYQDLSSRFKSEKTKLAFSLFTNLWAMDEKNLDWLQENKFYIHTSLDGPQGLHDAQRGKGSFQKAAFWIREMVGRGMHLNVSAVMTKRSLKQWRQIIEAYRELGLKAINFRALHPIGLGKANWSRLCYLPQDYIKFRKESLRFIFELNKSELLVEQKSLFLFYKLTGQKSRVFLMSPPCSGIRHQVCIDPAGDIYSCDEGRSGGDLFRIGDVKKGIDPARAAKFLAFSGLATKNSCSECAIGGLCNACLAMNEEPLVCHPFRCFIYREEMKFFKNLLKKKSFIDLISRWEKQQDIFLKWQ